MGALDGRVCIVTGGGRGIGRAHALLLAREGAKVVVNDLGASAGGEGADASAAQQVVDEILAAGGQAVASTESVADWEGSRQIVQMAVEAFGDLHVVINNAGIVRGWSFLELTEQDFDSVIDVHLKGSFNMTRWAALYWKEQSGSRQAVTRAIVNTSSGAGLHGSAGQANYVAAKAGIAALTLTTANELEPLGVRVNCIAPIANTRLLAALPGGNSKLFRGETWEPENISPLAAALSADGCPFNGQVFAVMGNSVAIYAGWAIAEEITSDHRWGVDELIGAMGKLPLNVEVRTQREQMVDVLPSWMRAVVAVKRWAVARRSSRARSTART